MAWSHELFVDDLASRVAMPSFNQVIELDALEDTLHAAIADLRDLTRLGRLHRDADIVVDRFEKAALPVFSRQVRITRELATLLRTMAFCLAAPTRQIGAAPTHARLCAIAADITLLERRRTGESPTTETIMLAMA